MPIKPSKQGAKKPRKAPGKKGKPGRPKTVFLNSVDVQKILAVFKIDGTVEEAMSQADLSPSTHYDRIEKGRVFLEKNEGTGETKERKYEDAVLAAQAFAILVSRKVLWKAIAAGDSFKALEVLKRRDKRYKDKQELSTDKDNPIQIYIPDNGRGNVEGAAEQPDKK